MHKHRNNKVLYLIQLPPPFHGVSLTNQFVYTSEIINQSLSKRLVRLNFSSSIEGLRRVNFHKFISFVSVKARLFYQLLFRRPDFVYFSFMPLGTGLVRDSVYLFLIKMFRVRVLLHLDNRGIRERSKRPFMKTWYRMVFRNTCVIHVTQDLLDREITGLNIKKLAGAFVVPNTAETFEITEVKRQANTYRLLFLSNLFPEKGLLVLLEAMKMCIKNIPEAELHIYGAGRGGKEDRIYWEFIAENGMEKQVVMHGPVTGNEKVKVYTSHDLFVFPSYFDEECFPLVLLEAMQAGLAIVTTGIGGIPEMVEHEKEALIVNPGDPWELAEAIIYLYRHPTLARQLGQLARERFFREFSMKHFERRMRKAFTMINNI
ncbi:MAG TPA: glycosyltransferase family 1 protein [Bacteroidetes bacterium]|nr:glycosyltransferase family 1 protein [Bacteroidota bacterium]